jgi:hypothetical protein
MRSLASFLMLSKGRHCKYEQCGKC